MRRPTRRTVTLFAAGSLVIALTLASQTRERTLPAEAPIAVAERGSLDVTLVEPGRLEAARSVTLASEIRSNRAKIVTLLGEGTWVRPGDVVVRFDATPFQEEREKALAALRDAEAEASRIEQERKLQIARAEEALEAARHAEKISRLNLEGFEKGSGALTVREAEVRAAESGSELARARSDLADLEKMFERGFVSEGELQRQRQKVEEVGRQAGLQSDRLTTAREVLYPRDLERARSELEEARQTVARSEALLYHTHEFYRAARESLARKVESAGKALAAVEADLAKVDLVSPIEGFLILEQIPLDNGRRKPQVGDSVWSGQAIATIPDLSRMIGLSRVREVDLHRLRTGLVARVDVEAYPDLRMSGTVDFVGNLAETIDDSPWKYFTVRLALDGADARLRPGMSIRVSFLLESVRDAVVVPADGVFTAGGRSVCYVRRDGETWEEPVTLGRRNETHVEVVAGVAPGEEILLAPPAGTVRRRSTLPPAA